ncbi:MAG TPA: MFS transporter [Xanthobacteraceae bacterium]|nr:MFS transporter [Xanthobacteraceae bacterium]
MPMTNDATPRGNSKRRVLVASMIGTTIEFFDFYIYATAAVLVFPHLFFAAGDSTTALLQSFATFSIAFFARPFGAAVFGHFGDIVGRKATLVASLMVMGISTVTIGLLPTYHSVGVLAPLLLALCRFGQGFGLGGEWSGAILLATENAPAGKRSWYGMFPQLGAPAGFLLATGTFLILTETMSEADFMSFGWRIPFVASLVLVVVGLLIRLRISETPEFVAAMAKAERVAVPLLVLLKNYKLSLVLGTFAALATFMLFYIMTVFSLSWGTRELGYSREQFLILQMVGVVFFALTMPFSSGFADRIGLRQAMIVATVAILLLGLGTSALQNGGTPGILAFLVLGFAAMGLTYAPLGTVLSAPFPTALRYTGSSMTFNLAGILGASLAPYIATWLASTYGAGAVGAYIAVSAVITLVALMFLPLATNANTGKAGGV